jgi:hypothetical protein
LARKYKQGMFRPKNRSKYKGDITNIKYRSGWELKFMQFCDSNPNVTMWTSEEVGIRYISPTDKREHTYWPDFLIKMKLRTGVVVTRMIEIKPLKQTNKPIKKKAGKPSKRLINEHATYLVNQAKWRAAREWCADRKIEFVVMTEEDLFPKKDK